MTRPPASPEERRYAALAAALSAKPGVSVGAQGKRGFGSSGLQTGGRILAMLSRGRLVLKLPRGRVDALGAAGEGLHFDPGHGRLMKEWFALDPASDAEWLPLAQEALSFVAAKR